MKIDTSKIEGYAEMTPEQKLAALESFEYENHAAELEKQKAAVSKANSDAAEWKRKHNALLTDDQRKQQEQADKLESMEKELAGLRKEKTVSEYKAKLVAQGYDEALANETAAAMESGDMTTVFTNNQKFLTDYAKRVVAEKLKGTPEAQTAGPVVSAWITPRKSQRPRAAVIMLPLRITPASRQRQKHPITSKGD